MEEKTMTTKEGAKILNSNLASTGEVVTTDLEMMEKMSKSLAWATQKIKHMKRQLSNAQPKIEFFDTVTDSSDAIDMKEGAKVFNLDVNFFKKYEI